MIESEYLLAVSPVALTDPMVTTSQLQKFVRRRPSRVDRMMIFMFGVRKGVCCRLRDRATIGLIAIVLLGTIGIPAAAATMPPCSKVWASPTSGDWADPSKWSGGTIPSASDDVCIDAAGLFQVTVHQPTTVNSLAVGGTSGKATLTLLATKLGAVSLDAASALIAPNGVLRLTSMGASTVSEFASTGILTVDGQVSVDRGSGGGRILAANTANRGTISINQPTDAGGDFAFDNAGMLVVSGRASLDWRAGDFTNNIGGAIQSGRYRKGTHDGAVFLTGGIIHQGDGTTSGSHPLIGYSSTTIDYTGTGTSTVIARGPIGSITGNPSSQQTLAIEGSNDGGNAMRSLAGDLVNFATIITTSEATHASALDLNGFKFTNANTFSVKTTTVSASAIFGPGTFLNSGLVSIDARSSLNTDASVMFVQDPTGTLVFGVMGKQEYGRLISSGTIVVGGTVAGLLGGQPLFNPVNGASFDTIHSATLIGTFTSTVPGDAGNGRVFLPAYSPTTVTLTATF